MDKSCIYEYDELMIGKRKSINPDFFSYGEYANELLALEIMRYAFETYLRWDPIDLRDRIDIKLLKRLKLDPLIKYLNFPPELDSRSDYFYIVWRLYPGTIHYNYEERVFHVYRRILEGKVPKFPKEYFTGSDGAERAYLCFRYMAENIVHFESICDMYRHFCTKDGVRTLQKAKLNVICRDLFGSPLEFVHASLPNGQKNELMYRTELFRERVRSVKRQNQQRRISG